MRFQEISIPTPRKKIQRKFWKFRGRGRGGGVEVSNANFVKTGMTPNWKYCNRGEEEGVKSKTVHRRSKDIF